MKTLQPREGVVERHLSRLPLFAKLPEPDIAELARATSLRLYERGEVVFDAGDPALLLYCVVAGSVRIVRVDPTGREKVLHITPAPATFAEMPVLTSESFPASAICNEPCTVVAVPQATLFALAERDARFPFRLLGAAMMRLHQVTDALTVHGQKSAVTRVAAYLGGLSDGRGCVELPGAKKDIANYLGLTPETFSRSLAALKQSGAIEVGDHTVTIVDARALERAIRGD